MNQTRPEEPWLRGTLNDLAPVPRAVAYALDLAKEDIERWCGGLSNDRFNARPFGIALLAFHIGHIARSMDRLLTYAEERPLTAEQFAALKNELDGVLRKANSLRNSPRPLRRASKEFAPSMPLD